ncbi:condensation domain-containing protein [Streptomyces sp. KL116D]|uniref:condensation domain-containing protein n=1 Tax=Streptomyces sp. KL116D TaxID=3045152 RepID=UPI00355865B7
MQYKDYTLWQRELLGDEDDPQSVAAGQLDYWRQELAGSPQPVQLPPRPAAAERRRPPRRPRRLLPSTRTCSPASGNWPPNAGATAPMVAQAALAVLLHHLGAGHDLTIGSPIEGRADEQLDDLIGFFANTWVLRVDLTGNPTFGDLLEQVRSGALAAYDNQDVPFERPRGTAQPDRTTAYQPLFQTMLAWQFEWSQIEIPGLRVTLVPAGHRHREVRPVPQHRPGPGRRRLRTASSTRRNCSTPPTAESLVDRYVRVLRQVVADSGTRLGGIDVLTGTEHDRLDRLSGTTAPVPAATVPELVAAQVARTPTRPPWCPATPPCPTRTSTPARGRLAAVLRATAA